MYFTWAAANRHNTARCNPANYVCGNAYGVPGIRAIREDGTPTDADESGNGRRAHDVSAEE